MSSSWNPRRLLLCHLVVAFLLLTFFLPVTKLAWDALDRPFFQLLNGSLKGHPWWQIFWALSSHKLTDWLHDIVMISLVAAAISSVPREERVKKGAQFVFCLIFLALVLFLINRVLFRKNLRIERLGPSLECLDSLRLSRELPWINFKDSSEESFPGDHATTALLFACSYAYYANRKLAIIGWIYAIFMCLPRLVVGAHWLSDIIVGTGSIVLFSFAWGFYSPLAPKAVSWFERLFRLILRKRRPVC